MIKQEALKYIFIINAPKKMRVRLCFKFPNGKIKDATDTINSGKTQKLSACTERANPKIEGGKRIEPKPTSYFVWDPEAKSGSQYVCK